MRQDFSQIDLGTRPKLRDKPSATWSTAMSRSSGSKGVAAPSLRTADAARFASLVLTWGMAGRLTGTLQNATPVRLFPPRIFAASALAGAGMKPPRVAPKSTAPAPRNRQARRPRGRWRSRSTAEALLETWHGSRLIASDNKVTAPGMILPSSPSGAVTPGTCARTSARIRWPLPRTGDAAPAIPM